MSAAAQNNISDLLKLARKFNCFYLSGMSTIFSKLHIKIRVSDKTYKKDFLLFIGFVGLHQGICKPFIVAGHQVGLIRPDVMKYLQRFPEVRAPDAYSKAVFILIIGMLWA